MRNKSLTSFVGVSAAATLIVSSGHTSSPTVTVLRGRGEGVGGADADVGGARKDIKKRGHNQREELNEQS